MFTFSRLELNRIQLRCAVVQRRACLIGRMRLGAINYSRVDSCDPCLSYNVKLKVMDPSGANTQIPTVSLYILAHRSHSLLPYQHQTTAYAMRSENCVVNEQYPASYFERTSQSRKPSSAE